MNQDEIREKSSSGFHYNRDERLQFGGTEKEKEAKKGILKGNRALIILLLDILIILFLYFILTPILSSRSNQKDYGPYVFSLRGFMYEGDALMSLRIVKEEHAEEVSDDRVFRVVFGIEGEAEKEEITELLPADEGSERTIRARLNPEKENRKAYADIYLHGDEKTVTVTANIQPEQ